MDQEPKTQAFELLLLNEWQIEFFPFLHRNIHRCSKERGKNYKECAQESGQHLDAGRYVRHGWYQITNAMSDLMAYVDGGSFGNPGPSGIGVVISGSPDGTIRIAKWIGQQDNNVAEYVALLEALQCALGLKAKALRVFSDSEVMVKQMSGEYTCRSPRLYSLNWICRKLARSLDFSISHIRRENNTEANRLASSAARNAQ
jgi:ribonuclease HI